MLTYNVLNDYVEKLKKNELTVVSTTTNIRTLTTADINKLKAGDIVLKEDSTGKHAYVVSYKKDGTGICMTYTDATYAETISYDYDSVTKEWVYNSMDSIEFVSKSYVDSLMSGALKREIVETLPVEDIDTNTIYMVLNTEASTQGNVYDEYMYINNSWELIGTTATAGNKMYQHNIILNRVDSDGRIYRISLSIINQQSTAMNYTDIVNFLGEINTDYPANICIVENSASLKMIAVGYCVFKPSTYNSIYFKGLFCDLENISGLSMAESPLISTSTTITDTIINL